MGNMEILKICNCNDKQQSNIKLLPTFLLKKYKSQQNISQNNQNKFIYFNQLSELFPYKYLGKGLYGTTVQVFLKSNKNIKFAQKIISCQNLKENYLFYDPKHVEKVLNNEFLKNSLVKVYAYQIKQDTLQNAENNRRNSQKKQIIYKMYLVMQLMNKGDLFFHLCRLEKKNGRFFTQKAIKRIAFELLEILQKFHQLHIIFRNIRPQNIFIQENGNLAVSDFLFSIHDPYKKNKQNLDVSQFNTYYGSAQYASPEVFQIKKKKKKPSTQNILKSLFDLKNSDISEQKSPNRLKIKKQVCLSPGIKKINEQYKSLTKSLDLKNNQNKYQNKVLIQRQNNELKRKQQKSQRKTITSNLKNSNNQNQKLDQFIKKSNKKKVVTFNLPKQKKQKNKKYRKLSEDVMSGQKLLNQHESIVNKSKTHNQLDFKNHIQEDPINQQRQSSSQQKKQKIDKTNIKYGSKDSTEQQDNLSQKRLINHTIDIWMLGIMLFQLIYGRTPFQRWKSTCDIISQTPAHNQQDEDILSLQRFIVNKNIKQMWNNLTQSTNTKNNISNLQKDFIQKLLIKQKQKRLSIKELKAHPFLQDAQRLMNKNILQVIYKPLFQQGLSYSKIQKQIKYFMKHKNSNLIASRTLLSKINNTKQYNQNLKLQIFSFEHQKDLSGE